MTSNAVNVSSVVEQIKTIQTSSIDKGHSTSDQSSLNVVESIFINQTFYTDQEDSTSDQSLVNEDIGHNIITIASFKKPKICDLKTFFKTHPVQPYDNTSYNPLIVYFRKNNNNKYEREWVSYEKNTKLFYCTFCLAFSKASNRFTIGCQSEVKHLYQRIHEHELSIAHSQCVDAYLLWSNEKRSL